MLPIFRQLLYKFICFILHNQMIPFPDELSSLFLDKSVEFIQIQRSVNCFSGNILGDIS